MIFFAIIGLIYDTQIIIREKQFTKYDVLRLSFSALKFFVSLLAMYLSRSFNFIVEKSLEEFQGIELVCDESVNGAYSMRTKGQQQYDLEVAKIKESTARHENNLTKRLLYSYLVYLVATTGHQTAILMERLRGEQVQWTGIIFWATLNAIIVVLLSIDWRISLVCMAITQVVLMVDLSFLPLERHQKFDAKYIIASSILLALHIWFNERAHKSEYLHKKKMETHGREKNEILDFLPDGAIIFKDFGQKEI